MCAKHLLQSLTGSMSSAWFWRLAREVQAPLPPLLSPFSPPGPLMPVTESPSPRSASQPIFHYHHLGKKTNINLSGQI